MYQSFKKPLAQKVESSSSAGNDASVHLSPSICIKGRNVDVDKFLEFVVAIAQDRQGWIDSGIFFQDVIEFAKINKIPMHTRSKTERTRFMVKHLIQDIQLYFIPRLKQLYPEKMQELLKEDEKNSLDRSLGSELQVKKVPLEPFNKRHIKILERVLRGESDLSPRDEKNTYKLRYWCQCIALQWRKFTVLSGADDPCETKTRILETKISYLITNFHQVFLVGKILWIFQRIFLVKKCEKREKIRFLFFLWLNFPLLFLFPLEVPNNFRIPRNDLFT